MTVFQLLSGISEKNSLQKALLVSRNGGTFFKERPTRHSHPVVREQAPPPTMIRLVEVEMFLISFTVISYNT